MRSLLGALLLTLGLAGAGCADQRETYCSVVTDRQGELSGVLAGRGEDVLIRALPIFEDLAAEAPQDVADDWQAVVERIEGLSDALEDAGVDPATYSAATPPAGLAADDRRAIERAATRLGDRHGQEALANVEQHVKDVCHTPLSR